MMSDWTIEGIPGEKYWIEENSIMLYGNSSTCFFLKKNEKKNDIKKDKKKIKILFSVFPKLSIKNG